MEMFIVYRTDFNQQKIAHEELIKLKSFRIKILYLVGVGLLVSAIMFIQRYLLG